MRRATLALALPLLAAPTGAAHAADSVVGSTCRLVVDPTELRLDVAAYHVVGGPLAVLNPSVASVTVTCRVLQDGAPTASVSETHAGNVGYAVGHVTVGTLIGVPIDVCTQVTWTGGTGGSYDDCGT